MNRQGRKKIIIIGAGLGGLINGILLKKAKPDDEVIIYDSNKIPGGFCTSFKKSITYKNDKIKYTFNVPVVTSDFGEKQPLDLFLKYLGVKTINWKVVKKPFQYYPANDKPFLFTKESGVKDLIDRTPLKEKKKAKKFFDNMKEFYNDMFYIAYMNPNFLEAIKMLIIIPKTVFMLMKNKTYKQYIKDCGIKTKLIQEIFSVTEGFMGVEVERASAIGELMMIQSFLENNLVQPANGDNFQELSNRIAKRFTELGGKLILNTQVSSISFDKKKANGVIVNNKLESADYVVMSVAQDRIEELIKSGSDVPKIKKILKKIKKIPFPNSDFYSLHLIDKKLLEKYPKFKEITYHIYRKNNGIGGKDWNLFIFIPDVLYNDKYYVMTLLYIEHDQEKIDQWIDLREKDKIKYDQEKEKMASLLIKELQEVEPIFKEYPPLKHILSMSPASFKDYGSKYPISGLAQTPENFGITRMKNVLLDNLFISNSASFSAGVWGAIAGGWIGFVEEYNKIYGIKIGNKDVIYKPGLKNLP